MTMQDSEQILVKKRPWRRSRFTGAKRPLKPNQIWGIRTRLQMGKRVRDLALFDLAIDSKLRGCDLVRLKIADIAPHGALLSRAAVIQRKTGRPVQFEITEQTRASVEAWLRVRGNHSADYLFPSRVHHRSGHLSRRQYGRLVLEWTGLIGLDPTGYGTHSLRRTKASLIYKKTGNLRAVQILLGHTKLESTVRYLGVEVEDCLTISEQTEI